MLTKNLSVINSVQSPLGILDDSRFADARCAFSPTRQLRRSYPGPAIRVRRSTDDAEQDFGFIGGVLDVASLRAFCGSGSGYVTKVYDQAVGSSDVLAQSTSANQPRIVITGEIAHASCMFGCAHTEDFSRHMSTGTLTLSDVSALTGIISYNGTGGVNGNILGTGILSAQIDLQKIAQFAATAGTSGYTRVGTTVGTSTNYNRWQKTVLDKFRVALGSIQDRTLNATDEVMPIRGAIASQTGWSQTNSVDCSGAFTDRPLQIAGAGTFTGLTWDIALLYKRAMSATDAGVLGGVIAPGTEGAIIGDSTISYYSTYNDVGFYIYTDREKCLRSGIANLAVSGNTIAQQKTIWQSYQDPLLLNWVIIEIGLNDMNPAVTTATTIAAIQDLVDTVRAAVSGSCKICIATMTPAYERWPATGWNQTNAQAKWVACNDAIMNRGGSPITGVDARTEDHTTALTYLVSGNAALAPAYDSGDHIHETNAGRAIIGRAFRTMLENLNLI